MNEHVNENTHTPPSIMITIDFLQVKKMKKKAKEELFIQYDLNYFQYIYTY